MLTPIDGKEPTAEGVVHQDNRLTVEEFQAVCRRLDELVREFEDLPFPEVREHVFELLQTVDALHREGLGRLVGFLRDHDQGQWIDRAAEDSIVQTVLELYDLVPTDPLRRDEPREEPNPANFIPLNQIRISRPVRQPVFRELVRLDAVPPGTMMSVDVDGGSVLLANVEGEIHAVRNTCPGSVAPLSLGFFTPPVVICPWHNDAFDVRTGKRADGSPGPGLDVLPISVQDGAILIAVTTAPSIQLRQRIP